MNYEVKFLTAEGPYILQAFDLRAGDLAVIVSHAKEEFVGRPVLMAAYRVLVDLTNGHTWNDLPRDSDMRFRLLRAPEAVELRAK